MAVMKIQTLEFTVEDILEFHRGWITSLYTDEAKTGMEIVELLDEHHLFVTLAQVQRCISEWTLVLPSLVYTLSTEAHTPSEDSWELISTPNSPTLTNTSFTPSDPDIMSLYTKRPLPSLPISASTSKSHTNMPSKSRVQKRQSQTSDRLRVTCHHGSEFSEMNEVEIPLGVIPKGPTQMDLYIDDEQRHERVAMGLEVLPVFSRAEDQREGSSRRPVR